MNWQMHTDFSPAVPRCVYRAAAEPHAFGRRRRGAAVQLDTGIAQGFRRAAADGELVLVRAPLDARGRAAQAQQHKHWLPRAIWCRAHSQVKNLPQRSPEQRARARAWRFVGTGEPWPTRRGRTIFRVPHVTVAVLRRGYNAVRLRGPVDGRHDLVVLWRGTGQRAALVRAGVWLCPHPSVTTKRGAL